MRGSDIPTNRLGTAKPMVIVTGLQAGNSIQM